MNRSSLLLIWHLLKWGVLLENEMAKAALDFLYRDGGNGRNGDLRGTHSIVATVATVAPYSVTATAGSSTTM